jgi:hypothetical protein
VRPEKRKLGAVGRNSRIFQTREPAERRKRIGVGRDSRTPANEAGSRRRAGRDGGKERPNDDSLLIVLSIPGRPLRAFVWWSEVSYPAVSNSSTLGGEKKQRREADAGGEDEGIDEAEFRELPPKRNRIARFPRRWPVCRRFR